LIKGLPKPGDAGGRKLKTAARGNGRAVYAAGVGGKRGNTAGPGGNINSTNNTGFN
jgi:hypothetical protein